MLKNKEYKFLIINYSILIICWIIFDSGIALKDNNILDIIGIINLLIHTMLLFGVEGIIYCIFSVKNEIKLALKIMFISAFINIFISIISGESSISSITTVLSINQIIGTIIGIMIKFFKEKKFL